MHLFIGCGGLSLLWGGLSLAADTGLFIAEAFLAAEPWALGDRASVVVALGLCCSVAYGIFVAEQGTNQCPRDCKAESYPLDHEASLPELFCIFMFSFL